MLLDKIKLEESEKVIIQTRRHWFILVAQLFSFVLAGLAPAILALVSVIVFKDWMTVSLSDYTPQIAYVYSAWLLFIWVGAFGVWTNYYLDILTLTDRRIIVINQKGFFWRNTGSFRLERMQDMNIETNGLIATMLDYGTINIETAGHSDEEFKVTGIPHPRELKALVLQAVDVRMKNTNREAESL